VTLIGVTVLLELLAGDVIAEFGTPPRETVTADVPAPKALEQETVIVFAPLFGNAAEFVDVLLDATPFTLQVVPAGMIVEPSTV
jgi:hypothetical protein